MEDDTFLDKVNPYYRLKHRQENAYEEKRQDVLREKAPREARAQSLSKIVKECPKCIDKRLTNKGVMVFTSKTTNAVRTLSYFCPVCKSEGDVQIKLMQHIDREVVAARRDYNLFADALLKKKLDILFDYPENTNVKPDDFEEYKSNFGGIVENRSNIIDNKTRNAQLDIFQNELVLLVQNYRQQSLSKTDFIRQSAAVCKRLQELKHPMVSFKFKNGTDEYDEQSDMPYTLPAVSYTHLTLPTKRIV